MENRHRTYLLLLAGILVAALPLRAEVITFDSYPVTDNDLQSGTITTQGFNFTADSFNIINVPGDCAGGCVDDGSQYLASSGSTVTVTSANGLPFSVSSLDAARLFLTPGGLASNPNADTLDLLGTLMGGGTVSASLTLPLEGSFSTFTLTNFADLSSLAISGTAGGVSGASWALDNLVGGTVPEPGSFLLAGLALGCTLILRCLRPTS